MSRIGKIARLPRSVREELNRRMEDGEEGKNLVAWLNGHAEVEALLKAQCAGHDSAGWSATCEDRSASRCARDDGRAINEPNLTAWRQGGFEDWRRQEEALEVSNRIVEEASAVAEAMARQGGPGGLTGIESLTDRVSMMAALAIGEQIMATRRMEEGEEKRRAVLKLVRGLVRLRNSDRACERGQREAAEAARAAEVHEDWAERVRRRPHADARGEMSEVRRKMTAVIAGMSDEEIEETLQMGGYLPGVELLGKKRVWWTEEDQALEESEEDADEGEDYEEDEDYDDDEEEGDSEQGTGGRGQAGRTETSTESTASTSTLLRQGSGGQASAEGADRLEGGAAGSGDPGPTIGGLTEA